MEKDKLKIVANPSKVLDLAWGVFLFSMVYFFCVTFIPIPDTGEDNAKYIVGFLVGTGVGSIISFYFRRNTGTPSESPQDDKQEEKKNE